ncbi:hypothetical protein AB0G83_33160, partial [Streptomyces klenkii]
MTYASLGARTALRGFTARRSLLRALAVTGGLTAGAGPGVLAEPGGGRRAVAPLPGGTSRAAPPAAPP